MSPQERRADPVDLGECVQIRGALGGDRFQGPIVGDRVGGLSACGLQAPGPERLEQRLVLG